MIPLQRRTCFNQDNDIIETVPLNALDQELMPLTEISEVDILHHPQHLPDG